MAIPDFPTHPPRSPAPPRNRRTAILLAVLLGPLGLMYTSVGGGLFMLFVTVVAGLFTVGIGIVPAWLVSVGWAYVANSLHHEQPPGEPR